jgi:hypothetical protein
MIPGVSRAGATIMGALMLRVDRPAATEFSFFLAIPTMFGASVYDLYKNRAILSFDGTVLIAIGFVVAFFAALFVVRRLVDFVSRHGFGVFAWYRIVVGAIALVALALQRPVSALLVVALCLHARLDDRGGTVAGLFVHDLRLLADDAGALPIALTRREDVLVDIGVGLHRASGEPSAILIRGCRCAIVSARLRPVASAAATRQQQQERATEPHGVLHRSCSAPCRRASRRARMARFSTALASYQARISSIVRRQPRHMRVAGSIRQIPRQGDAGGASLAVTVTSLARPDRRAGCAAASRDRG